MLRISPLSLSLIALVGLVVVAGCRREEPGEIRLGLVAPLSGPLGDSVGGTALAAAVLAIRQVNAAGGLLLDGRRRRVVLVTEDDHDRPDAAVQAARKLINQEGVAVLVGPLLSRNALEVAPLAESLATPMISPTASHPELTVGRRWVFQVAVGNRLQSGVLARFARDELGAGTAAVLYDVASAYNRNLAEIFRDDFVGAGGEVVAMETYTTGERDFRRHLGRIRDIDPDVLFLPNYVDDIPLQASQARELGLQATLLGGDTWNTVVFPNLHELEGAYVTADWHAKVETAASTAFVSAYRKLQGETPGGIAARTYDAFGLIFRALEARGTAGPELRQGLAEISGYQGVTGTISYRGGNEPLKDVLVLRIRDGDVEVHRRFPP